ncbi:MAG TPA: PAS domain S-box protein [Solirubrobacteraceae bacterium]|nr:PAS domain S-box protein [Solirubrobacteraceae bacterium]
MRPTITTTGSDGFGDLDPNELCAIARRLRSAIGAGPHAIDPDTHALEVALLVLTLRAPVEPALRRQVERAAACVAVLDGSGVLCAVSHDLAARLGYEPAELVGRVGWSLSVDPDRSRGRMDELVTDGQRAGVSQLRHRDGRTLAVRFDARAVQVDGRTLYLAIGHEIDADPGRARLLDVDRLDVAAAVAPACACGCELAHAAGILLEPEAA